MAYTTTIRNKEWKTTNNNKRKSGSKTNEEKRKKWNGKRSKSKRRKKNILNRFSKVGGLAEWRKHASSVFRCLKTHYNYCSGGFFF